MSAADMEWRMKDFSSIVMRLQQIGLLLRARSSVHRAVPSGGDSSGLKAMWCSCRFHTTNQQYSAVGPLLLLDQ